MPTRRQLIGAGAASVALAAAAAHPLGTLAQDDDDDDDNQSSGNRVIGTPTLQPAIDLMRAQEIALEGNGDAAVTKVELEGDDGVLKYDVYLNNGIEVEIDATTGAVIRTEQSDDDNGDDDHNDGQSGGTSTAQSGDDDHGDDDD